LHYEFDAGEQDVIRVRLDKQACVRLLDTANYSHYRSGRDHHYYGGVAKVSPVDLRPPRRDHWHLVIDLGGFMGTILASAEKISV
jgi:hypothetical protein